MKLWDVNLWVYAFRSDSPLHGTVRRALEASLETRVPFLFHHSLAVSFLRLVTNPKIFVQPSPPAEAWLFIDALVSHPSTIAIASDPVAFGIFKHLCLVSYAKGNTVPDLYLASLAICNDARLVTADRGFLRIEVLETELIC